MFVFILQAQKKRVAVFTSAQSSVEEELRTAVRDVIQEGVFKSGRYEVLEREEIDMVQKELLFQANASDGELIQWAQKIPDADYSAFASISKIGAEDYQVTCKLIEAGSSYKLVYIDSRRTKKGIEDWHSVLEYIANEMFSGRSGRATILCPDCCYDGYGYVDCELSFSDEKISTYEEAISVCEDKGYGWSLPSIDELESIYRKRQIIFNEGGRRFKAADYWSSSRRNNYESFSLDFRNGEKLWYSKLEQNVFRCVKKYD